MPRLDQERQKRLEDMRMAGTRDKLLQEGCGVDPGPDQKSFRVTFPNGKWVNFWPYSGWFQGPGIKPGRGFDNLLSRVQENQKG